MRIVIVAALFLLAPLSRSCAAGFVATTTRQAPHLPPLLTLSLGKPLECQQQRRGSHHLLVVYSSTHGRHNNDRWDLDAITTIKKVVATTTVALLLFLGSGTMASALAKDGKNEFKPTATVRTTKIAASTTTTTPPDGRGVLQRARTRRYWDVMNDDDGSSKKRQGSSSSSTLKGEKLEVNEQLVEYAVGTVNTMYYDASGGFLFQPPEFYHSWRELRDAARKHKGTVVLTTTSERPTSSAVRVDLTTRQGAVATVKHVISKLNDPFSKYLTREELMREFALDSNDGFLGLGAVVEVPTTTTSAQQRPPLTTYTPASSTTNSKNWLSVTRGANLPMVTAVAPDSPAERAGFTVGDRIVAVGDAGRSNSFVGETRESIRKILLSKYNAENYMGYPSVTLAKPVLGTTTGTNTNNSQRTSSVVLAGYRTSHVHLPTMSLGRPYVPKGPVRGDGIVHYEMLNKQDSIYLSSSLSSSTMSPLISSSTSDDDDDKSDDAKVGYIRLTRFSRAATAGFVKALEELEKEGAKSYIIDLRNNYGGIIQEAMLTASSLLRDPHAVLCFTMNARGGFTPHDVEEYVLDNTRYPGYLLSEKEPKTATLAQIKREDDNYNLGKSGAAAAASSSWGTPPSSFASLYEQTQKRGIAVGSAATTSSAGHSQKPLVLLINEGTASSAEVFASALHDNHRLVALVGSPTYGKGLIQHTFPMPDGGGLRLTVAEYLTPSLHHVRPMTPIQPDIYCGKVRGQGVASNNIGADMCVGVALDALNDYDMMNGGDKI